MEEAEGVGGARLPATLPPPGAELLLRSRVGVVAAAAVGDALSGSALILLESDVKPQGLRPYRAAAGTSGGEAASAVALPAGASSAVAMSIVWR